MKSYAMDPKSLLYFTNHVLWSMPPGDGMEKGREYDDMIGCTTMSLSQCLI